jgi:hypothetical protein
LIFDAVPAYAGPLSTPTLAAGVWIVSNDDAIQGWIPQYQLEAPMGGYVLLHSYGVIFGNCLVH